MFGFANETAYDAIILDTAGRHGVPPALVKAIIAAESSFRPEATRYEAHIQDASLGLMQILFNTARWVGFTGAPADLYDPATGIEYGTRYLKKQWDRYNGALLQVISAYNAGTARPLADGIGYVNQSYVDKVSRYYAGYAAEWPDTGASLAADPVAFWTWGADVGPPAGWGDEAEAGATALPPADLLALVGALALLVAYALAGR